MDRQTAAVVGVVIGCEGHSRVHIGGVQHVPARFEIRSDLRLVRIEENIDRVFGREHSRLVQSLRVVRHIHIRNRRCRCGRGGRNRTPGQAAACQRSGGQDQDCQKDGIFTFHIACSYLLKFGYKDFTIKHPGILQKNPECFLSLSIRNDPTYPAFFLNTASTTPTMNNSRSE